MPYLLNGINLMSIVVLDFWANGFLGAENHSVLDTCMDWGAITDLGYNSLVDPILLSWSPQPPPGPSAATDRRGGLECVGSLIQQD